MEKLASGKVLQVAIIGQGRSGSNIHALSLMKWPDKYKIAAIADGDESRQTRFIPCCTTRSRTERRLK